MTSVAEALADAPISDTEAQLLLAHVLGCSRTWLFTYPDAALNDEQATHFQSLLQRRRSGEPIAYILGYREFWSLKLEVSPAVLIPRPDTELLVSWALELIPTEQALSIIDVGTGSGAVALALASERPRCRITGVDISSEALDVARANAERLKLNVAYSLSDCLDGLPSQQYSLIVSNPPYIEQADPHLSRGDLPAEPVIALASGPDGLDVIRRLIESAPVQLLPGGHLLLEHGWNQGDAVRQLLLAAGFSHVSTRRDLAGHERVTGGRWL